MFLDLLLKAKPVLDEGYSKMNEQLQFLFENENLDFTTALAVFYLSYGMENVHWEMVPARNVVRGDEMTETLGGIVWEICELCRDVSGDPLFEKFISSLKTTTARNERYDVAQALTRATSILYVCDKYKDRLDYGKVASGIGRYDALTAKYGKEEAMATLAIMVICSFLKFGGLLIPDEEYELCYSYCVKSPFLIYDVLIDDMNRKASGKVWFERNAHTLMKAVCKDYAYEKQMLKIFGPEDWGDEECAQ